MLTEVEGLKNHTKQVEDYFEEMDGWQNLDFATCLSFLVNKESGNVAEYLYLLSLFSNLMKQVYEELESKVEMKKYDILDYVKNGNFKCGYLL